MRSSAGLPGVLLWLCSAALAGAAAGDSTSTALDTYLNGLTSLRTNFSQTVTDAHGSTVESGAGTLIVQRPGRFRWDYSPKSSGAQDAAHSGQLLVADA